MSTDSHSLPSARWPDHEQVEAQASNLYGLLHAASRLKLFLDGSVTTLRLLALLLAVALIALFLDAAFAFPDGVRIGIDVLIIACGVVGVGLLVRDAIRNRFDARKSARQVEDCLGIRDSSLINAVEFSWESHRGESPILRERTIRMADARSREISSLDVHSFSPFYRSLGLTVAALGVVFLSWLLAPRVFSMVVPRYLDPTGGHPPFTLVTFDVTVTPDPVYRSRSATISVELGGPENVEEAFVRFVEGDETSEPVSMFRADEQQFVLEIEQAEQSREFYIDTPRGQSDVYPFDVVEVPFFGDLTARFEYPGYTGWAHKELPLNTRGIRTLVRTDVVIRVSSNLPLKAGRLTIDTTPDADESKPARPPQVVILNPLEQDSKTVEGRFRVTQSGAFSLSIIAKNGAESLEPMDGPIVAVPDRPPRVSIVQPQPHIVAVENWTVPVVIEAVDDVGIETLTASRSVNGWGPSGMELPFEELRSGIVRAETGFNLDELGAQPGDIITYYVTAQDNHPAPPQFADSETYVIRVIAEEEYIQFARQQFQMDELIEEFQGVREELDELEQQREDLLDELESLQKQLADDPDNPETLEKIKQSEETLQKFAEQTETLSKRLEERIEQLRLYDLEDPYYDMLERLSKQLQQQSSNAAETAEQLRKMREQGLSQENQQDFEDALERLQKEQDPFGEQSQQLQEQATQDLELFQQADAILAQAERLKSVIRQQRDLADRLKEFQDRPQLTPEQQHRADQLAKEQEMLEQELQDVREQLQQAADNAQERLPKMSASAQSICDAIGDMEIPQDQQQAAQNARSGSGKQAHERAESAAEKLESLSSQCPNCQGAAGEMTGELDGPLSLSMDGIQRTLEQLSQGRSIPGLGQPGQGQGQQGQPGQQPGSNGSGQQPGGEGTSGTGSGQMPAVLATGPVLPWLSSPDADHGSDELWSKSSNGKHSPVNSAKTNAAPSSPAAATIRMLAPNC